MEMLARYVIPEINGDNRVSHQSFDWARANRESNVEVVRSATKRAFAKHEANAKVEAS